MFQGWVLHGDAIHWLTIFRVITIIVNLMLVGFCFRYLQYVKRTTTVLSERANRTLFTWGMICYATAVVYGLMVKVVYLDNILRPGTILVLVAGIVSCIGMARLLSWRKL